VVLGPLGGRERHQLLLGAQQTEELLRLTGIVRQGFWAVEPLPDGSPGQALA
jgi:hypothetical protein